MNRDPMGRTRPAAPNAHNPSAFFLTLLLESSRDRKIAHKRSEDRTQEQHRGTFTYLKYPITESKLASTATAL